MKNTINKRDLTNYGIDKYFEIFHVKGTCRKTERFTIGRILECIPIIVEHEIYFAKAQAQIENNNYQEEVRRKYCADLKVHPERYINRKGLREKGVKPSVIKRLEPLFYVNHGYYIEYYYYNY